MHNTKFLILFIYLLYAVDALVIRISIFFFTDLFVYKLLVFCLLLFIVVAFGCVNFA